jgi:hypothetical protein
MHATLVAANVVFINWLISHHDQCLLLPSALHVAGEHTTVNIMDLLKQECVPIPYFVQPAPSRSISITSYGCLQRAATEREAPPGLLYSIRPQFVGGM